MNDYGPFHAEIEHLLPIVFNLPTLTYRFQAYIEHLLPLVFNLCREPSFLFNLR